ncbi:hypothetical protein [Anaerophilus nitritogenes]|uniref:hypothetical protein n=1 Tax=Anaerophilus nitritogenes TaxID=2498136 RepID=UPI00101BF38A|nr:hypothetical protein [Anaerophilus nitritogenes]
MSTTVFYATTADYKILGSSFTKKDSLSRDDSTRLRNMIQDRENGLPIQVGILTSIMGGAITGTVAAVGYSIATGTAIGVAASYFGVGSTLSKKFDKMATGAKDCHTVELEYRYRRKDGKEGAYWLSNIKILD